MNILLLGEDLLNIENFNPVLCVFVSNIWILKYTAESYTTVKIN